MAKPYFQRYNELADALERAYHTEVVERTPAMVERKSAAPRGFRKLVDEKSYAIPEDYLSILEIPNTLALRFFYDIDEAHRGAGEFKIRSFYSALTSNKDPKLSNTSMHSEEDIEILKHFRIIDEHPFSGDFKLAAFYKKPGASPPAIPQIYFYDRGTYYPMNLDYFGYLDAVLDLAGIANWQYLFCDVNLRTAEYQHIHEDLKRGIEAVAMLFPDKDLSRYEQLLAK